MMCDFGMLHWCSMNAAQVEFVVAFIGTTLARAVAAPLNSNYKKVCTPRTQLDNNIRTNTCSHVRR